MPLKKTNVPLMILTLAETRRSWNESCLELMKLEVEAIKLRIQQGELAKQIDAAYYECQGKYCHENIQKWLHLQREAGPLAHNIEVANGKFKKAQTFKFKQITDEDLGL